MSPDRRFYTYVHRRETDGQIFYVGKGIKGRARSKCNRSLPWLETVANHGIDVQECFGPAPEACAFTFEKILIHLIGRERLVNLTIGGGAGPSGYKFDRGVVDRKAQKCMKPVANSSGEVFASLKEAARSMRQRGFLKATESHISSCCTGNRHVAYGFSWSFDTWNMPDLIDASSKVNEKRRRAVRASNRMTFRSVTDAANWVRGALGTKCGTSDISRCCDGRRKACGGLNWEYVL